MPPVLQPGDVLTLGETPLAVIQGGIAIPAKLSLEWWLGLCRVFHPTSSLAQLAHADVDDLRSFPCHRLGRRTADEVVAIPGGFSPGGDQTRLIDDITGTTPPYDKPSCWVPQPLDFCRTAAAEQHVAVAIVDVNDLTGEGPGPVPVVTMLCCSVRCAQPCRQRQPAHAAGAGAT